jgi:hypothetical protein
MRRTDARLAAWALLAGTVIATGGYLTAFLANGYGDVRFTGSSWTQLYTIALFGDVLVLLGLPALLYAHGERSRALTLIGYVGIFIPLVVLNVGEGSVEAFVKPYLAKHGGLPDHDLPGLDVFEAPAILVMLVGMICLAVAVFRVGALPRWIGVAFAIAPVLGAAGLSGGASLIPDYLVFVALFAVGVHTLRPARERAAAPAATTVSRAAARS